MANLQMTEQDQRIHELEKKLQVLEFNLLLINLAESRIEFNVYRCDTIELRDEQDDMYWLASRPDMKQYLGKDLRVVVFPWDNRDIVIYEFDVNGAHDARMDVEARMEELK